MSTTGTLTEYPLSTGASPEGIVAGFDGNLWFAENGANKIGRISPGGVLFEYAIPTDGSQPQDVAVGPDGSIWFTEQLGNNIGRVAADGTVTEYAIPTAESAPQGIVAGADGNMWFVEVLGNAIGRITPTANPTITEFAVPTVTAVPAFLAAGLDGNLWFTEFNADLVGRFTPSSACAVAPGNGCSAASESTELNSATWVAPSLSDAFHSGVERRPHRRGDLLRHVGHGVRRCVRAAAEQLSLRLDRDYPDDGHVHVGPRLRTIRHRPGVGYVRRHGVDVHNDAALPPARRGRGRCHVAALHRDLGDAGDPHILEPGNAGVLWAERVGLDPAVDAGSWPTVVGSATRVVVVIEQPCFRRRPPGPEIIPSGLEAAVTTRHLMSPGLLVRGGYLRWFPGWSWRRTGCCSRCSETNKT